jgi:hypothetical protein
LVEKLRIDVPRRDSARACRVGKFKVGTSARVDPEETEAEALYLTKLGKSK